MDSPKNSSDNTGFSTAHALVVAIAAYTTVTPLPVAVINDARDITSVLTSQSHCGYAPNNVRMLLDGEATLEALRHELDALAERSGVDDTVVIFFSGHGALIKSSGNEESGLVPIDCDPKHLSATVLSEAEFSAALARIKAQRLVVFIDACHSGGVSSFKGNGGPKPVDLGFSEKSLDRLVQGAGRVFIASSRASEVSRVLAGASNSLFTQHLLDALRGNGRTSGDGFVRIFRWGYPGKNRKIDLSYALKDVEAIRVELKQGIDAQRTIYLRLKGKREIPLTGIGQPLTLKEIEKQASELANFLQISLEGL